MNALSIDTIVAAREILARKAAIEAEAAQRAAYYAAEAAKANAELDTLAAGVTPEVTVDLAALAETL